MNIVANIKSLFEDNFKKIQEDFRSELFVATSKSEIFNGNKFQAIQTKMDETYNRINKSMIDLDNNFKNRMESIYKRIDCLTATIDQNRQIAVDASSAKLVDTTPILNVQKIEPVSLSEDKESLRFSEPKPKDPNDKRGRPSVKVKDKGKPKLPSAMDGTSSPEKLEQENNVNSTSQTKLADLKEKIGKSIKEESVKSQTEEKMAKEVSKNIKSNFFGENKNQETDSNLKINVSQVSFENPKPETENQKNISVNFMSKKPVEFRGPRPVAAFSEKDTSNLQEMSTSRKIDSSIFNPKRMEPIEITKPVEKPMKIQQVQRVVAEREKKIKKSTTSGKEYPREMFENDDELFCFK